MNIKRKIKLYYAFKFLQNAHLFGAVLVPFYTVWAGMSEQTVLLLQSWFMVSVTLLELPTGLVADKFGRKTSLVLGAGAAILGLIFYGLYANIYLFLVCESVLALAMAFTSGADEAWLIDTLNQHVFHKLKLEELKMEVVGKGQSFMFLGMIVGTSIGSLVAKYLSLNATMYLSAIPALVLLFVVSKMPEPKVHKVEDEVFQWKQGLFSLKILLKNRNLRYLSINLILVSVSAYFVIWLYQPLLQRVGVDIFWFGLIHALFIGLEMLISSRFVWLEKRYGLSGYLQLSALITAFGFLLLVWKLSFLTILAFVLISGSFGLTRRFFAVGQFHNFVASTYRASISSSFSLLLRFSIALANLVVGWLFVQSIELTMLLLGILPILAVIFFPLDRIFDKNQ